MQIVVSPQDFGYVQVLSTEGLKPFVCNQPEVVSSSNEPVWLCSGGTVVRAEGEKNRK